MAILGGCGSSLDTDVAIVGAGVVGCAIARELSPVRPARDAARGRAGRGRRHEQGEHRAAPHRLRREARARSRRGSCARGYELLQRVRPPGGHPGRADGRAARGVERGAGGGVPGISSAARANGSIDLRTVDADELYRREPHLGPGAHGALEVPRRGARLPVHDPARLRDRGGAVGLRPAPLDAGGRRWPGSRTAASVCTPPGGELTAALARERRRPALRRARPDAGARRLHGHARGVGS